MIFRKLKQWLQKSRFKTISKKAISIACVIGIMIPFLIHPSFAYDSSNYIPEIVERIAGFGFNDDCQAKLTSFLIGGKDYPYIFIWVSDSSNGNYPYIIAALSYSPFYLGDDGYVHSSSTQSTYITYIQRGSGLYSYSAPVIRPNPYDFRYFIGNSYANLDSTANNIGIGTHFLSNRGGLFLDFTDIEPIIVRWGEPSFDLDCSVNEEYILCNCTPSFDFSDIVNVCLYVNNFDDYLIVSPDKIVNPIEYSGGITFLIDCLYIMPLSNLVVDKVVINVQPDIQYVYEGRLVIRTIYVGPDDYTPSQTIINQTWQELLPSDLAVNTSFYGQEGQIVTSSTEYEFLYNHDMIDISGMNCLFVPSTLIMNLAYLSDFYKGFDIVFWNCDDVTMQRVYGSNWEQSWDYTTDFLLDISNLVNHLIHGSPSGTGLNFDDVQVYYSESYFLKRGIQSLGVCNDSLVSIDANLCSSFEWLSKALTNIGTYSHDSASYLYSLSSLSWSDVFATINSNLVSILTAIESGFANVSSSVSTVIQDTFIYDFFAKSKEVYDGILEPSKDLFLDTYSDTSYAITDGSFEFSLPGGNLPSLPEFPLIEIGGE